MLAPQLKKKVDQLWNRFWAAGLTNPLVAIEQITYLLFLKRLEALDNERVKKGKVTIYQNTETCPKAEECKWSYIRQSGNPVHMNSVVFPWLRQLETQLATTAAPANGIEAIGSRMSDAHFQLDPNKGAVLTEAINIIDQLFARVDTIGPAADIMGDTFEYLLSEIATAGKNGQFRTPRHLIRFMVELLDPQPGERIIDPAAGTGGFLFSAQQYLLIKHTTPESLRIEWDGTPHRVFGDGLNPEQDHQVHDGRFFVGLDNDRTMVRIGWMNLILHGLEDPQIHQRDSLGKRKSDDPLLPLLEPESHDIVLANPPFTGTVDTDDLDAKIGPPLKKPATKSELLFVWRMLELLDVGGRCAVIVPEGVLFGSTEAHQKLRQELLTEHQMDAVISLPGGAFQPYTGVKTSILVFRKLTRQEQRNKWKPSQWPETRKVWFYEVEDEAWTPDAKRVERRGKDNDLWDALEKFRHREDPEVSAHDYYQPEYTDERWKLVDDQTVARFADFPEVRRQAGQAASLHELFSDLAAHPGQAEEQVRAAHWSRLEDLIEAFLSEPLRKLREEKPGIAGDKLADETDKRIKKSLTECRSLFNKHKVAYFEKEESKGWPPLKKLLDELLESVSIAVRNASLSGTPLPLALERKNVEAEFEKLALDFAKLDGYDVTLRSIASSRTERRLPEPKSWSAPVRAYAINDEWQDNGGLIGSHDKNGKPRAVYLAWVTDQVKGDHDLIEFLDPDCIEARGWNLSAGQYKPFGIVADEEEVDVTKLIRDLQEKEQAILSGLDRLLAMVEDRE